MFKTTPNRILVIRYRFIGDTLLMVPFLRNLRYAYPDAQIDVLVAPNSGELLKHCPYINNLFFFDTTRKHRYENPNEMKSQSEPRSFWTYVDGLRKQKYDCAFVLKRSFSSAFLAFCAGIPQRIGYGTEFRNFLLTKSVPYEMKKHERNCFFDVLEACDIPVEDDHLEAWWSEEDNEKANKLLGNNTLLTNIYDDGVDFLIENQPQVPSRRNILIHLTSSNRAKQWTKSHSIDLIEWLVHEKDANVFSIGAHSDKEFYDEISKKISSTSLSNFNNLCGETNLLESLAFIKKMDFVVGVDSGTLHMAAAVGVPVIALFGPMDPVKWAPIGKDNVVVSSDLDCRPCNLKVKCKRDFECMSSISLSMVQEKISQKLDVSEPAME